MPRKLRHAAALLLAATAALPAHAEAARPCRAAGYYTVYAADALRVLVRSSDHLVAVCDAKTNRRSVLPRHGLAGGDANAVFAGVPNVAGRWATIKLRAPVAPKSELLAIDVRTGKRRLVDQAASHEAAPFGLVTRTGATLMVEGATFPAREPQVLSVNRPGSAPVRLADDVDVDTVTLREVRGTGDTYAYWRTPGGEAGSAVVESAGHPISRSVFSTAPTGKCRVRGYGLSYAAGVVRVLSSAAGVVVCDAGSGRVTEAAASAKLSFVGNAAGDWVSLDLQSTAGPSQRLVGLDVTTGVGFTIQSAAGHDNAPDGFVTADGTGVYTFTPSALASPGSKTTLNVQTVKGQTIQISDDVQSGSATVLPVSDHAILYWRAVDDVTRSENLDTPTTSRGRRPM